MATGSASDLTRGFRNQPRPRQHRVYRCLVIVEHALRLVRAGLSDEFRSELIHPMNQQGCVWVLNGLPRNWLGRAWNPSERETMGPTARRNILLHNEMGNMRHLW